MTFADSLLSCVPIHPFLFTPIAGCDCLVIAVSFHFVLWFRFCPIAVVINQSHRVRRIHWLTSLPFKIRDFDWPKHTRVKTFRCAPTTSNTKTPRELKERNTMSRCHPIHVHHHLWSVYSCKDSKDSLSCQTDASTVETSHRYVAAQVRF